MTQDFTKESFIEASEKKIAFEYEVQQMYGKGVPKSHMAKHYTEVLQREVTVYEITKIVEGNTVDVGDLFFFKKYRKMAVRIYWDHELYKVPIEHLAARHDIEPWLAAELFKIFQRKRMERVPVRKKDA